MEGIGIINLVWVICPSVQSLRLYLQLNPLNLKTLLRRNAFARTTQAVMRSMQPMAELHLTRPVPVFFNRQPHPAFARFTV